MMSFNSCGAALVGACLLFFHPLRGEESKVLDWKVNAEVLERYYEQQGKPPPWSEAVEALFAKDQTSASNAGRFLVDLATQVLADEISGTSRWRSTPFWGGPSANRARDMREYMIRSIAKTVGEAGAAQGTASLPVLDWFIRKDPVIQHRLEAMAALVNLDGKESDALVESLACDATLIHSLSATAIRRATARVLNLPESMLLAAMADHHADRRNAANLHWRKQFGSEPVISLVRSEAVQSPEFTDFLGSFDELLLDPPPADAAWVEVVQTWKNNTFSEPESEVETSRGWLVEKRDGQVRISDLHGRILEFTLGKNPDDGWRGISTVTYKELPIIDLVNEIEALRKEGDPEHRLLEQGDFSGQFQGTAAGVPEMLLALQLHRSGKPDLCARVLFPALDSHPEDRTFFEVSKHRLATVVRIPHDCGVCWKPRL